MFVLKLTEAKIREKRNGFHENNNNDDDDDASEEEAFAGLVV